jgi:hypothetical protein
MTKPSFNPLTEISELGRDVITNPDKTHKQDNNYEN